MRLGMGRGRITDEIMIAGRWGWQVCRRKVVNVIDRTLKVAEEFTRANFAWP